MGWLWASSSPQKPSEAQNKDAAAPPSKVAPNEPNFDPEIQKFVDLFSADTGPKKDTPIQTTTSSTSSSNTQPEESKIASWLPFKASSTAPEDPVAQVPRRDALSEALLPTEMSCRQAFDLAWSCNSLGGQWNAVYRNGEMRSCSDQWDDFWFCMRQKSFSGPVKEEAVRDHYRHREYAKYHAPGQRSSEDIWQPRDQKLPPGAAFSKSIDVPTLSDDEWRQQEQQRRAKIREDEV